MAVLKPYLLLVALLCAFALSHGVPVNITPGDTIECVGLMPQLLAGNPVALQEVLDDCQADLRCSEITGQSEVERLPLFDMILSTIDSVGPSAGRNTLTPLYMLICNKTLEQINEELWPILIRMGMCDVEIACGFDDQPQSQLIDPDTGKVNCEPLPGRETSNPYALDAVTVAFGILLILLALVIAGVSWYAVSVTKQKVVVEQKLLLKMQQRGQ